MFNTIKTIFIQLSLMPFILRLLTIAFIFFGILGIITTIFPIANYSINNVEMSYLELWQSGYSFLFLFINIIILSIGLGFYYQKNWSRYLAMLPCIINAIAMQLFTEFDIASIVGIFLITLIPAWYLFKKKAVVNYFKPL